MPRERKADADRRQARNARLTDAEWDRLLDLAGQFGSLGESGPLKGRPAVNALLREIASGGLRLSRVEGKNA